MRLLGVALFAFGVAMTMYAALETEPEEIGRRATWGILGLALTILGVLLI